MEGGGGAGDDYSECQLWILEVSTLGFGKVSTRRNSFHLAHFVQSRYFQRNKPLTTVLTTDRRSGRGRKKTCFILLNTKKFIDFKHKTSKHPRTRTACSVQTLVANNYINVPSQDDNLKYN